MNVTRRELFRSFYSKRIYFFHQKESFKEEVVQDRTLKDLLRVKCRDWEKTPLSYLSAKEALAVGVMLFIKKSYKGESTLERAIELCEHAYMETKDPEYSYLASMALGVLYFENALIKEKGEQQEKFFKVSSAYLKTAKEMAPEDDHSSLYEAIVQRGRGQDLHKVAKTLVQASKVSEMPMPIYKLLCNIYKELDMDRAADFYRIKFEEEELVLNQTTLAA